MPAKVVFTESVFLEFVKSMVTIGFRRIKPHEFRTELRLANVEAPSPRKGREEGFTFFCLGLRVIIWTSFVESLGQTREDDAGRVLILENNKPVYFGTWLHRTTHYFERLFLYALAAKEHVENRPTCPTCGNLMSIFQRRKGSRQCFWICRNPDHKKSGPCISWSNGLSDKAKQYLLPKWDRAAKYYAKQRAEGEEPRTKHKKGWRKKDSIPQ